ncbi:MAG: HD domain-containing protein, partial [Chloroflexi bacterium]|nr:HD domain-containing protein [Chloroflexota bacterium]
PYVSVFEICRQLKQNLQTRFVPILVTTPIAEPEDRLKAIELGVDDFVSNPFNPAELSTRIKYLLQLKNLHDDLDTSESILFSLVEALEAKDPFTSGHSRRVAHLSCDLARFLGLPARDIELLRKGGLLHDIGKIGVKEGVLLKEILSEGQSIQVRVLHLEPAHHRLGFSMRLA